MTDFIYDYRHEFDSSLLREAYYNKEAELLVVFLHEGRVNGYGYANITESFWRELVTAESAGQFYNWHVKGKNAFDADFDDFVSHDSLTASPVANTSNNAGGLVSITNPFARVPEQQEFEVEYVVTTRDVIRVKAVSFDAAAAEALSLTSADKIVSVKSL